MHINLKLISRQISSIKTTAIAFCFMIAAMFSLQAQVISPGTGVIINEIDLSDNTVELFNPTSGMVDVGSWRLCVFPAYESISNLFTSGPTLMMPGSYLVINWSEINPDNNELGLYLSMGSFGDPASILDYVQYGAPQQPRVQVAVMAGVWDDVMNFVPFPTTQSMTLNNLNFIARNARDTNSNHWWESFKTAGFLNVCIKEYTMMNTYRIGNRERGQAVYITNGVLESDQDVLAGANAFYSSITEINMFPGFMVELGADFLASIEGCFLD